jgi:hypothetical protein
VEGGRCPSKDSYSDPSDAPSEIVAGPYLTPSTVCPQCAQTSPQAHASVLTNAAVEEQGLEHRIAEALRAKEAAIDGRCEHWNRWRLIEQQLLISWKTTFPVPGAPAAGPTGGAIRSNGCRKAAEFAGISASCLTLLVNILQCRHAYR